MPKILLVIIILQMLIYFSRASVTEVKVEANPEHSLLSLPSNNFPAAYLRKMHPFLRRQRLTKSMKSLLRSLKKKRKKRNYVFAFNITPSPFMQSPQVPNSTLTTPSSSQPPFDLQKPSNNAKVNSTTATVASKAEKVGAPNSKNLSDDGLHELFSENLPRHYQERRKFPRNADYHKKEPADMISLKWNKLRDLLGDSLDRSNLLQKKKNVKQEVVSVLGHLNDVKNDELILPSSTTSESLVLADLPAVTFDLAAFDSGQPLSDDEKRLSVLTVETSTTAGVSPTPQIFNKSSVSKSPDLVELNLPLMLNKNPLKPPALETPNASDILVLYSNVPVANLKLAPPVNPQNLPGPTVNLPGSPKEASDVPIGNFSKLSSPAHSVKIISNGSSNTNLKSLSPSGRTSSIPTNPPPVSMPVPIWTSNAPGVLIPNQSSVLNLSNAAAVLGFPLHLLQPSKPDSQYVLPPGKLQLSTLKDINAFAPHHLAMPNLQNSHHLQNLLVPHLNRSSFAKLSNTAPAVNLLHSTGTNLISPKSGLNSPKSSVLLIPAQFANPQNLPNSAMVSDRSSVLNSHNSPELFVLQRTNSGNSKSNPHHPSNFSTPRLFGALKPNLPILSPAALDSPVVDLSSLLLPIASDLQVPNSISEPVIHPSNSFANLKPENTPNSLKEDARILFSELHNGPNSLLRSTSNSLKPNVQISNSSNLTPFNSNGSPSLPELLSYLTMAGQLNPFLPLAVQQRALNGPRPEFPSLDASLFSNAQLPVPNPLNAALPTSLNLAPPDVNNQLVSLNSLKSEHPNSSNMKFHGPSVMSYNLPESSSSILQIPNSLKSPGPGKSSEASYVAAPGLPYYYSSPKSYNEDALRLAQSLLQNLLLNSYKSPKPNAFNGAVPGSSRLQGSNVPQLNTPHAYEVVDLGSYEVTPKSPNFQPANNRPAANQSSLIDLNQYRLDPSIFKAPVVALPKSEQNPYHKLIFSSSPKSNNSSATSSPTPMLISPGLLELISFTTRKPSNLIVPVPVPQSSKAVKSDTSSIRQLSDSPGLLQLKQYNPSFSNSPKLASLNSYKLTNPTLNSPKHSQKSSGSVASNSGSFSKNSPPQDSFKLSIMPLVNLAAINSYPSVTSQPNFLPLKTRESSFDSLAPRWPDEVKLAPQHSPVLDSFDPIARVPLELRQQDLPNPEELVPVQSCNDGAPKPYKIPQQAPCSHGLSPQEMNELLDPRGNAPMGNLPCPPLHKPPPPAPRLSPNTNWSPNCKSLPRPCDQTNVGVQQLPPASQLRYSLQPPPPGCYNDSSKCSSDLPVSPASKLQNQQLWSSYVKKLSKMSTAKCLDTTSKCDTIKPDATTSSVLPSMQTGDEAGNTVESVDSPNVMDQILKNIEQLKNMQAPKDQEEMSCSVNGSWSSSAGGVVINITASCHKMEATLRPKSPPCKNGFLVDYKDWSINAMLPFSKPNRLILSGSNNKTKDVFTFIGECRYCGGTDMISGNWLLARPSVGCNDQRASSETISDMWRKEKLNELRGSRWKKLKMLKSSTKCKEKKTRATKPSCGHKKKIFPRMPLPYSLYESTTIPYDLNNVDIKSSTSHMGISTETLYQKINPAGKIKYRHYDKVFKKRIDQTDDGRNI